MKAFYFSNMDKRLRYGDNRLIKRGITHTVSCQPKVCEQGLHASLRPIDALNHAPDSYLWLVDVTGKVDKGDDKIAGTSRRYIDGFDATDLLRKFARKQALIDIEKIKPYCTDETYRTIVSYLETGNDALRSAARSAAESAARSAESAAWSAARSAARAAESAAWSAAWSAAELAAWSAAWSAARSASESAAVSAAESAAESASWSASWSAARAAANDMLLDMIREETGWKI